MMSAKSIFLFLSVMYKVKVATMFSLFANINPVLRELLNKHRAAANDSVDWKSNAHFATFAAIWRNEVLAFAYTKDSQHDVDVHFLSKEALTNCADHRSFSFTFDLLPLTCDSSNLVRCSHAPSVYSRSLKLYIFVNVIGIAKYIDCSQWWLYTILVMSCMRSFCIIYQ